MLENTLKPATPQTSVYTDFNGFSDLRRQARKDPEAALRTVAKQFEAIFLQMALKSMRQASMGDPIFDSSQSEVYRDMFDKQLSLTMSENKGLGLSDALIRQLRGSLPKPPDSAVTSTEYAEPFDIANVSSVTRPAKAVAVMAPVKVALPPVAAVKEINHLEIESPEDFVKQVWPYAQETAKELGVDPRVLIAQAALETGWGKYISQDHKGNSSFNMFNIKADQRWDGDKVTISTIEFSNGIPRREKAQFRAYNSIQDSFNDYADFVKSNPRYKPALEQAANSEQYIDELHQAGYATDPEYSDKIKNILQRDIFESLGRAG